MESVEPGLVKYTRPRLSAARIEEATAHISAEFRDTPQFLAENISEKMGCRIIVKVETVNPIRSFKARGAQTFVSRLDHVSHVVCVTAGNFGQGMAYAARSRGLPLTAFAKSDANRSKISRISALGADVSLVEGDLDKVYAAAKAFSDRCGALFVEDGREAAIAEGAGTIGIELMRWKEPIDAIVVPVGDGALLGGIGTYVKHTCADTRLIGVCARGAPAMERSWRTGRVQTHVPDTIADGIAIQTPFAESLAELLHVADDFLLVDEATIGTAMRVAFLELGVLLEPAGAAGLAAIIAHQAVFRGKTVAVVLSGGNPSEEQLRQILA